MHIGSNVLLRDGGSEAVAEGCGLKCEFKWCDGCGVSNNEDMRLLIHGAEEFC